MGSRTPTALSTRWHRLARHSQFFSNEEWSVSRGCSSRLMLHHRLHSLLHFFRCRLRLVCADHPRVAVWIDDVAAAVTPEHVHHGTLRCCAKLSRFFDYLIHVLHVNVEGSRRGTNTFGAASPHLLALRPQHQRRATQREFSVNGFAIRPIHDRPFRKAKCLLVKTHRGWNVGNS